MFNPEVEMAVRSRSSDFLLSAPLTGLLLSLGSVTWAVAETGSAAEAGTFFARWYATVVGVIVPLAAAGVAIGFIARAVGNARDGSSPVAAVIGALITASGAMLVPTVAVQGTAGADLMSLDLSNGASSMDPSILYAYLLIRHAKYRFRHGRAQ